MQRTYVLRASAAMITPDQIAAMSPDDMRQAFLAFVAGLLGDVDRYLARDGIDPVRDGASFRLGGLWLDDAQFTALLRDLMRVLQPAAANPPGPGRKRRILATVLLPDGEPGREPSSGSGSASQAASQAADRPAGPAANPTTNRKGPTATSPPGIDSRPDRRIGRGGRDDDDRPAAISTAVLELARANRFTEIHDLFAPNLRPMLTPETLWAAWNARIERYGPITAVGVPVSDPPDPAGVQVRIPITFTNGRATMLAVVADAKWVTGIQFADAERPGVTFRVYDADNHLLFTGLGPSKPSEYEPAQHMGPAVVTDIAAWLTSRPPA